METDRRHRKPKEQITDVIHVSDTVYTICVRVPSLICLSTDTHSLLLSFRICKMGTRRVSPRRVTVRTIQGTVVLGQGGHPEPFLPEEFRYIPTFAKETSPEAPGGHLSGVLIV